MKHKVKHRFVEYIPEELVVNELYISINYKTAVHLCCCGCGEEVVTPIDPKDWSLSFNGEVVSLSPSIGNWEFNCRSHYWIKKGCIIWAENWSKKRVLANRIQTDKEFKTKTDSVITVKSKVMKLWKWLLNFLFNKN